MFWSFSKLQSPRGLFSHSHKGGPEYIFCTKINTKILYIKRIIICIRQIIDYVKPTSSGAITANVFRRCTSVKSPKMNGWDV